MWALVTGGAGFIGSHLVDRLVADGHRVRVLDDLSTGSRSNLDTVIPAIELIQADVRSAEDVARAVTGVDVVFHLAALPSVARSWEDPLSSLSINGLGTATVAEAAKTAGVATVVYASSSSVYGDQGPDLRSEDMPIRPQSPYAMAKLLGERLVLAHHERGFRVVALRYFNVFGPRQDPASPYSAVIAAFLGHALAASPATVYGDGLQSRDFTYVADVIEANLLAWRAQAGGVAVNVASGQSRSVLEVARAIGDLDGRSMRLVHGPARSGDVRHSRADLSRARRLLGYEPSVSFEEGLRRTYESLAVPT